MGVISFRIPAASDPGEWPEAFRSYMTAMDGRIFPSRMEREADVLVCRRPVADSGKFHVIWPVAGFGRPVVATASLPERSEPYVLPIELARGKIVAVRNQAAAWEPLGSPLPDDFLPTLRQAQRLFSQAILGTELQLGLARESLETAFVAGDILARWYTAVALERSRARSPKLPALLGCELGQMEPAAIPEDSFGAAFSAASIQLNWKRVERRQGEPDWELADRQLEWCEAQRLTVCSSTLVDLGAAGLPEWLWRWEHDFENLASFASDYVETAVARFQGRIRIWEIVSRGNSGGAMTLSEEQRLKLTAQLVNAARRVDDDGQFALRIDQPWGEYASRGQHRLTPLQFADALLRSGIGLTAVNLEIAMGYRPRGSAPRDLLETSRMIDQWSLLGVPLHVTLVCPSSDQRDALANPDIEAEVTAANGRCTREGQADWLARIAPLLIAKPAVVGVFWNQLADALPHEFPAGGLLDLQDQPKPALGALVELRQMWSGDSRQLNL